MATTVVQNSNQAIKVNGAVSNQATFTNATVTLYTAPAGGYAIVQIYGSPATSDTLNFTVGGRFVYKIAQVEGPRLNGGSSGFSVPQVTIYVGPSQSLQVYATSGSSSSTAYVSGVEFINSLNGA